MTRDSRTRSSSKEGSPKTPTLSKRDAKVAVVLLVCVLFALTGLYLYIHSIPVQTIDISSIKPSDAGKLVRTEGFTKDLKRYSGGSIAINLTDLKGYIDAFFSSSVAEGVDPGVFVPGAYVSVAGKVTVYKDKMEIMVQSSADVSLITPAGGKEIPVKTIVSVPEALEGMKLSTHGEIVSIKGSTANLTLLATDPQDTAREILIAVDKQINETIIYRDVVDVYGEFTYGYEFREGWRVVVHLPEHGISRFGVPNAPSPVKLGDVLNDTQRYANTSVHIEGLLVMKSQNVLGASFKLTDEKMSISCFIYWYEWKRTDIVERDLVRFTGVVQYYVPQGAWRISSESPDDLVKMR